MSKTYALTAQKRERAGKGVARALRREDRVPAVIYGDNKEPSLISLGANQVKVQYMKGGMTTHLCELDVEGSKVLTLARDIQVHPVSDKIEHVDFMRVSAKTKIAVSVPVHFLNQDNCPGIKNKGILNVVRHDLELLCSATDIPEFVEVDLKSLEIGDSVKISDIKLPNGAQPASRGKDKDLTIASIVEATDYVENEITGPQSDEEVAAAAAAAAGGAAPAKGAPAKGAAPAKDAKAPAAAAKPAAKK